MKKLFLMLLVALLPMIGQAQRIQQKLGRGVVVVKNTSNSSKPMFVSWRKLAQEPASTRYNVYVSNGNDGTYTKLNAEPLAKTNMQCTATQIPDGAAVAVTTVVNGVENGKSVPFVYKNQAWRSVFFDFDFDRSVINPDNYNCAFVWPMDLDGNGEFNAVVCAMTLKSEQNNDPMQSGSTPGDKLQCYLLDGTLLWTADVGPHIDLCAGQNDMVLAYDIDCDGRCEVILKSSDGTRFWDAEAKAWGKYANFSDSADTDGDGISDYRFSKCSKNMNPPYYISVLDGRTGCEKDCAELNYSEMKGNGDQYSRTNRNDYMADGDGTEYAFMGGHFGIVYADGIHPYLVSESMVRRTNKNHHGYMFHFGYDWVDGKPTNFHHCHTWARTAAEAHGIRIADVDGDGIDEMCTQDYAANMQKGLVSKAGVAHGDRFDISDIDPSHPGLECFSIQQYALLGELIFDCRTGEHLVEKFLSTIGDVGRGRCMDVDPSVKGYEFFSTMENLYDCKGNVVQEGGTPFPYEAVWWDGTLQREQMFCSGGSGYGSNLGVSKYNGTRVIEFSRDANWAVHAGWAARPCFVGDIYGDWREEIIIGKQNDETCTGLVGYSTFEPTDYVMYCLQEDPHYRLDCTTRGYYQAPCTGFYLGEEMPEPQLPPVFTADLRWKGGEWADGFTSFDMTRSEKFVNGKSIMIDMSGDGHALVKGEARPSDIYIMTPRGKSHYLGVFQSAVFEPTGTIYKSMEGEAMLRLQDDKPLNCPIVISEGTLEVMGTLDGDIDIKARGRLKGNIKVNGNVTFEGAMNYEGCALMLGMGDYAAEEMVFTKPLTIPGNVYLHSNIMDGMASKLTVEGDLTLKGVNTFVIEVTHHKPTGSAEEAGQGIEEGEYILARCKGELKANVGNIYTLGLDGVNYDILLGEEDGYKTIVLKVNGTRKPAKNVIWAGTESNKWNYKAENFMLNGEATPFVSGDEVVFDGLASVNDIQVDDVMMTSGITVSNEENTVTFSGEGNISGDGAAFTKTGAGEVVMNNADNDFTGAVDIQGGTVTIATITDGGKPSPLGAAPAATAINFGKATLKYTGTNDATDRQMKLNDTLTVNITKSNGSVSLKGRVSGTGFLEKSGPGILNLCYGGTNPYGGTRIKGGTLGMGAWNTVFGGSGKPMYMEGGTIVMYDVNSTSTMPDLNHKFIVKKGTKNYIKGSSRAKISGSIEGEGSLDITTYYVRNDVYLNAPNFQGTLYANSTGGNFRLMDAAKDFKKARIVIGKNTQMAHFAAGSGNASNATTSIGSIESADATATLGHGGDTYNVGYDNSDFAFSGKIAARTLGKYGEGVFTIKSNTNTSAFVIYEGTLQLNNTATGSPLVPYTTGLTTVKEGATLRGNGVAGNIKVERGGTLVARNNTIVTTLKVEGTVTLMEGSTLEIALSNSGNAKYRINGTVTHNGDTLLITVPDTRTLGEGDEISVFTGTATQTGSYVIKTVSGTQDIVWDDSTLFTDGKLRVASAVATGIHAKPSADEIVDVYDLQGIKVRASVPYGKALDGLKGVYIINGTTIIK